MIVIDSREPKDLIEKIKSKADDWRVEELKFGDFISGEFIVERKRYGDFIGRMTNSERDIWWQLMGLKQAAEDLDITPILLLEGEYKGAFRHRSINPMYLASELAAVLILGVSTIHSMNQGATVKMLTRFESNRDYDAGSIRDSPSVPEELYPRYLMEGFLSIGPSKAEDILRRYGSFGSVVQQILDDPDEFLEIPGIGQATVDVMVDMVTQEIHLSPRGD